MLRNAQSMIKSTPPMTSAEESDLIERAKAGDEAATVRILTSLVKLIYVDAKRWGKSTNEDLEDLMQLGIMGLLHAIEKFDPDVGCRFSTYAGHWWRQSIRRGARLQFAQGRSGVQSILFSRYYRLKKHMDAAFEEDDDPIEGLVRRSSSRRDVAAAFIDLHHQIASLDTPISDGDPRTWSDMLVDNASADADDALERSVRERAVRDAVDRLPERMRSIIYWRHLSRHPLSFEQIGQRFGVTRQAIQQAEAKALRKLRQKLGGVDA